MEYYEVSLTSKAAILAVVFMAILPYTQKKNLGVRLLLFNYGPIFAFSYYFILLFYLPFSDDYYLVTSVLAGFIFEGAVLFVVFWLLNRYFRLSRIPIDYSGALKLLIIVKVFIFFALVSQENFGILAGPEMARTSFLQNNKINKYLVYFWHSLMPVAAIFVAHTYAYYRKVSNVILALVALEFLYSYLSGSKGSVLLWIFAIFALIPNSLLSTLKRKRVIIAMPILVMVSVVYVIFAAKNEGLDIDDFLNLASSRFFLNNDARALSLDFDSNILSVKSFFESSFRGASGLIGFQPVDRPLGNVLFNRAFGITDGRGSNASLVALINYYLPPGLRLVFSVLFSFFTILIVSSFFILERFSYQHRDLRLIFLVLPINVIVAYSQDFLAFPLILISSSMIAFFLLFVRKCKKGHC